MLIVTIIEPSTLGKFNLKCMILYYLLKIGTYPTSFFLLEGSYNLTFYCMLKGLFDGWVLQIMAYGRGLIRINCQTLHWIACGKCCLCWKIEWIVGCCGKLQVQGVVWLFADGKMDICFNNFTPDCIPSYCNILARPLDIQRALYVLEDMLKYSLFSLCQWQSIHVCCNVNKAPIYIL